MAQWLWLKGTRCHFVDVRMWMRVWVRERAGCFVTCEELVREVRREGGGQRSWTSTELNRYHPRDRLTCALCTLRVWEPFYCIVFVFWCTDQSNGGARFHYFPCIFAENEMPLRNMVTKQILHSNRFICCRIGICILMSFFCLLCHSSRFERTSRGDMQKVYKILCKRTCSNRTNANIFE